MTSPILRSASGSGSQMMASWPLRAKRAAQPAPMTPPPSSPTVLTSSIPPPPATLAEPQARRGHVTRPAPEGTSVLGGVARDDRPPTPPDEQTPAGRNAQPLIRGDGRGMGGKDGEEGGPAGGESLGGEMPRRRGAEPLPARVGLRAVRAQPGEARRREPEPLARHGDE